MPWVKIDDNLPNHPKVIAAGLHGLAFTVAGIAYCQRNLTDGFIPALVVLTFVPHISARAAQAQAVRMVGAGLWELRDGGYQVHDYHDFNPTKEEVLARRAEVHDARVAAGRQGGIRSGEARRASLQEEANAKQTGSNGASNQRSKGEAKSKQTRSPTPTPTEKQVLGSAVRETPRPPDGASGGPPSGAAVTRVGGGKKPERGSYEAALGRIRQAHPELGLAAQEAAALQELSAAIAGATAAAG